MAAPKLEARIEYDIELVSSCGKVVTIPFHCHQKNSLRFYSFTFFHPVLARKFCEVYQRYLPKKRIQSIRSNYDTLVSRSRLVEKAESCRSFKVTNTDNKEEVEEEVVLSDVDAEEDEEEQQEQEQGQSRRKRKRLNPVEDKDDDPHGFNEDFLENQFGYSQQY